MGLDNENDDKDWRIMSENIIEEWGLNKWYGMEWMNNDKCE